VPNWKTWWIQARIQKNLDLLTLECQPAPELDAGYRGHPVLTVPVGALVLRL